MLRQRIVTAVISFPLAMVPFLVGNQNLFVFFFACCAGLTGFEVARMLYPRIREAFNQNNAIASSSIYGGKEAVSIGGIVFPVASFLGAVLAESSTGATALTFGVSLSALFIGCFLASSNEDGLARVLTWILCIVYAGLPWVIFWDLNRLADHSAAVFMVLAVVWGGDMGAYFGGLRFGKRKLAPRMSPKKTIEGAVFGVVGSLALAILLNLLWKSSIVNWDKLVVVSVLGGIAGQVGDLVESTMKRFAKVKDSGSIFPGHGGFLDRIDGLLFAAPVIWFILKV